MMEQWWRSKGESKRAVLVMAMTRAAERDVSVEASRNTM